MIPDNFLPPGTPLANRLRQVGAVERDLERLRVDPAQERQRQCKIADHFPPYRTDGK